MYINKLKVGLLAALKEKTSFFQQKEISNSVSGETSNKKVAITIGNKEDNISLVMSLCSSNHEELLRGILFYI